MIFLHLVFKNFFAFPKKHNTRPEARGGGGFFHSKGTWDVPPARVCFFKPSSLAKGILFANFRPFSLGKGILFGNFGQRNVKLQ